MSYISSVAVGGDAKLWHRTFSYPFTSMTGAGGTPGGTGRFFLGLVLAAVATYFFFDSVVVTAGRGWISGRLGGWWGNTTSTGLLFVPFLIGVIALFYDSRATWAWGLATLGLLIVAIEILSRLQFILQMKTSHLLVLITMFGAGIGLMLSSLRDEGTKPPKEKEVR